MMKLFLLIMKTNYCRIRFISSTIKEYQKLNEEIIENIGKLDGLLQMLVF